jgi:hypothetical protein
MGEKVAPIGGKHLAKEHIANNVALFGRDRRQHFS